MNRIEIHLFGNPKFRLSEGRTILVDRPVLASIVRRGGMESHGKIIVRDTGIVEFSLGPVRIGDPEHIIGSFEFVDDLNPDDALDARFHTRRYRLGVGGALRLTPMDMNGDRINLGGTEFNAMEVSASLPGIEP